MVKCLVLTFEPGLRMTLWESVPAGVPGLCKSPKCSLAYRHIASTTYRKTDSFTASLYIVAMEQGTLSVCLSCVCVR